jgi:hypothetical protein
MSRVIGIVDLSAINLNLVMEFIVRQAARTRMKIGNVQVVL